MKNCPECGGPVRPIGTSVFCLDCDFDTLVPVGEKKRLIPIDAEFYTKTQLRTYRKWKDRDFALVQPFYNAAKFPNCSNNQWNKGYYIPHFQCFDRWRVAAHEQTHRFTYYNRAQTPVPEDEKIHVLGYDLLVRGDELLDNGWTYEMIDKLPTYKNHRWRKLRRFRLCDLKVVSKTFRIITPEHIEAERKSAIGRVPQTTPPRKER